MPPTWAQTSQAISKSQGGPAGAAGETAGVPAVEMGLVGCCGWSMVQLDRSPFVSEDRPVELRQCTDLAAFVPCPARGDWPSVVAERRRAAVLARHLPCPAMTQPRSDWRAALGAPPADVAGEVVAAGLTVPGRDAAAVAPPEKRIM